jgi:hypothetical protein
VNPGRMRLAGVAVRRAAASSTILSDKHQVAPDEICLA